MVDFFTVHEINDGQHRSFRSLVIGEQRVDGDLVGRGEETLYWRGVFVRQVALVEMYIDCHT